MRGVAENTIWMLFGIAILGLTVLIVYLAFPHSNCDAMAKASAEEVQRAIECAANNGIYPKTGESCSKTALVRLCQEEALFGVGYLESIAGLNVPEYMIYYREFPKKPVTEMGLMISESYPFERMMTGQRPWDVRPTLTGFKEFWKTEYLNEPCTSGKDLCFDVRGQQGLIKLNDESLKSITKIKLDREGCFPWVTAGVSAAAGAIIGGTVGSIVPVIGTAIGAGVGAIAGPIVVEIATKGGCVADVDPTFYLISPCYANVNFKKEGTTIKADVHRCDTGSSNYCILTENKLKGLLSTYIIVRAIDIAVTTYSLGTAEGWKPVLYQLAGKFLRVELGGDTARGVETLVEASLWPGLPNKALKEEDMSSGSCKMTRLVPNVFEECCKKYLYEKEKNINNIICDKPEDIVDMVKGDVIGKVKKEMSLNDVGSYIGYKSGDELTEGTIQYKCKAFKTENTKECFEAEEMKEQIYTGECKNSAGEYFFAHTYDFGASAEHKSLESYIKGGDCQTDFSVIISNDKSSWTNALEISNENLKDGKHYNLVFTQPQTFQYARISAREAAGTRTVSCPLEYTSVTLDMAMQIGSIEDGKKIELGVGANYFESKIETMAKNLCEAIDKCTAILKVNKQGQYEGYYREKDKEDFEIKDGDIILIFVSEGTSFTYGE